MRKFKVTGMSCSACSSRVEKEVSKLSNVETCQVNLLTNSMSVIGTASDEEIIGAVISAGYNASVDNGENIKDNSKNEIAVIKNRLIYSLGFLLVLMYLSMGYNMLNLPLPTFLDKSPIAIAFIQMALCIAVIIINKKFFISGFRGVIKGSPNMDTLVSLGSLASFAYSAYNAIIMCLNNETARNYLHDLYFESSAMILVLITLGKLLESYSKGKTTDALKSLAKLAPKMVTILKEGQEVILPIESLKEGDVFIVKPGEYIPADGEVIDGVSDVDESALTGESVFVEKISKSKVYSATINQSGVLKCRADKVGENTTLSQIIKTVQDAQSSNAPISKIADKVSGIFVPIVMALALLTTITWLIIGESFGFSLSRGVSVLVISCPCALGLATPVAIMVGSGVGAKNGILFKTAVSLENLGKVKVVALDKTGTITLGKPKITDVIPFNGIDAKEFLSLSYSLEYNSEHPLANSIIDYCNEKDIEKREVLDFKVVPGNGLNGKISGTTIYGGNLKYVTSIVGEDENLKNTCLELSRQGKTPLIFANNDKILGVIAVSDVLKSDSKNAINSLKEMDIYTIMLTGDNSVTANSIGHEACVDKVIADVLPEEKGNIIKTLKNDGMVAMVGDGINDAIALTNADIGVAIGAGTDIAIDSAEVVLVNNSLTDLVNAIKLSKKTLKTIRENLFWAFFYNAICIPIAMGVLAGVGLVLNPMIGAGAMSLSSLFVVTNALRLKRVKLNISNNKKEKVMNKTIKIEGMMCPHCEARVKGVLEGLGEVITAEVSHKKGCAKITLKEEISNEVLQKVIDQAGYKVLEIK